MEEEENISQSTSKQLKSVDGEDNKKNSCTEQVTSKSSDSQCIPSHNNNDSGMDNNLELELTPQSSKVDTHDISLCYSDVHIGDSGLDVACHVTVDDVATASTSAAASGAGDGANTNMSVIAEYAETISLKNDGQHVLKKKPKAKNYRNRLTCISSSSDDDKNGGDNGISSTVTLTPSNEMGPSSSALAANNGVEAVNNDSLTGNNLNSNRRIRYTARRGRAYNPNRIMGRNYRNRWAYVSSPSSSSDENEPAPVVADVEKTTRSSCTESSEPLNDIHNDDGDNAMSSTVTPTPSNEMGASSSALAANGDLEAVNNDTPTANSLTSNRRFRLSARRGRAYDPDRIMGRNYRNRWAYVSSPSSSSDEDEPAPAVANVIENTARSSSPDEPLNEFHNSVSSDTVMEDSSFDSVMGTVSPVSGSSSENSHSDERMNDSMNEEMNADQADALEDLCNKPKPVYTWNATYELMRREHGLTGNGRYSLRNDMSRGFNTRFYASRHVVERMKLLHCLRKHNGCVNCLNFNRAGNLLCSGSDDMRVVVWDWAQNKVKHVYKSGHTENIFQTKFIESGSSGSHLDIVSASHDGEVRRAVIPSAGGKVPTVCLYKHRGPVHKIVVCPQSPTQIISVGEDGCIKQHDLRKESEFSDMLKVVKGNKKKMRLFSISHHPFNPEICVSGCDRFVRVYDKRNMKKTVHEMCPQQLVDTSIPQVTCCVYNSTGSEILSSYSDDHIYLFNNKIYKKGDYLHRYMGHTNQRTIKGVNFFGPNSEYVISGSDCSHIFYWDKNTEAILNHMPGDTQGVVNCLEPHPFIPILATSGLAHNIKIWAPNSETYPPDLANLKERLKKNLRRSVIEDANDMDDPQFNYFIRQFLRGPRTHNGHGSQSHHESQTSSSSSEDDNSRLEAIQCRNQ